MPNIPGTPIGATAGATASTVIDVPGLNLRKSWTNCGRVMPELVLECPDCGGKGILERMEPDDGRRWLEVFPQLCERCSGAGKVSKPTPGSGDS